MEEKFSCIICKNETYEDTGKHPRDRASSNIVICRQCQHIQMFPLLSEEEFAEEYATDKTVRMGVDNQMQENDMEKARVKFAEWTKQHVDMYWGKLQEHKKVLELGSGYGFFAEELNKRADKKFMIEGVEIGDYRLKNYVGGTVYNINFLTEEIPKEMKGSYDFIVCLHVLEHLTSPVTYLRNIQPLLTEGGTVLFEVPNVHCFLSELSPEYSDFTYLYEHVSYYHRDTLKMVFERAGYEVTDVYTKEIYSIENHVRWIREGVPFTKYNQMYLPDSRIEFINEAYKKAVSDMDKGYALIIEATPAAN